MSPHSIEAIALDEETQYYVFVDSSTPTVLFRAMGTSWPSIHLVYQPAPEVDQDPLVMARRCLGDQISLMRKGNELTFYVLDEEGQMDEDEPARGHAWLEGDDASLEAISTQDIIELLWALSHTLAKDDAKLYVEDSLQEYSVADYPEIKVEHLSNFRGLDEMMANHRLGKLSELHYSLVRSKRWTFDHDEACTAWFDFRGQMGVHVMRFSMGADPGSLHTVTLLDDLSNDDESSLYEEYATAIKALRRHLIPAYVAIAVSARPELADFLKSPPPAEPQVSDSIGQDSISFGIHRTPTDGNGKPLLH